MKKKGRRRRQISIVQNTGKSDGGVYNLAKKYWKKRINDLEVSSVSFIVRVLMIRVVLIYSGQMIPIKNSKKYFQYETI